MATSASGSQLRVVNKIAPLHTNPHDSGTHTFFRKCSVRTIHLSESSPRSPSDRELLVKIRARQMRFVGHVMRRGRTENLSLTGRIPGCRTRGRQREKYMDGITRTVDGSKAAHILQMTRDREMWQSMVANVCRGTALR